MSYYAELRALAEAAIVHRHEETCYRNGSGPWCVFEPNNIDHWTVLLKLLGELELYRKVLQNIVLADVALSIDGTKIHWPIEEARKALNLTKVNVK